MISKDQALKIAASFHSGIVDRIAATLASNAQNGVVGLTIGFDNASAGDIDKAVAALGGLGWVVARDDIGKTLTITDK